MLHYENSYARIGTFSDPKRQAMGEELAKLLEAGFIRDIKHPDWLANLVMVPKKDSGKSHSKETVWAHPV